MSLSERPPFSRNWRFQIGEFQTLQILVQICDSQITNQWKIDENQSKIDEHLWIDENEWKSKKFLIPKQFIRGRNVNINIHKRFPRAAGYKLQATGQRRQAASYRQQAAGEEQQQARGYKQQATSYRLSYRLQASCFGVDPKIISVCWRAFRKQWFPFAFVA